MTEDLEEFSKLVPAKSKDVWLMFWHSTIWHLWKARNENKFKGESRTAEDIFEAIDQIFMLVLRKERGDGESKLQVS